MTRKNGFLIIDDFSFLDKAVKCGNSCYGWVQNEKSELFLFKSYFFRSFCYRELLVSKLANLLHIKNVGYDLAIYKGKYGVITKSCTLHKTITMKEIIWDYIKMLPISESSNILYSFFNVDTLNWLLKEKYKKCKNYNEAIINESLIEAFLFQILFGNCDLNAKNLEIDEETLEFLPFYDFGGCASIHLNRKQTDTNFYYLKRIFTANLMEPPQETFSEFLRVCTKEEIEKLRMYLEWLQTLSLKQVTQEIEEKLETKLPLSFSFLKLKLIQNWKNVDQIIKKDRRKF